MGYMEGDAYKPLVEVTLTKSKRNADLPIAKIVLDDRNRALSPTSKFLVAAPVYKLVYLER